MISRRESRAAIALLLATSLASRPAYALVSLNDGHDKIFVTGSVSVSRDSNVFANSDGKGDAVYSTSVSAEYTRRAGWIGVNANASVGSSRFATIKGQDFDNPMFGLEFTKQTGRTTGSLTLSASRESRADAAVNTRSTSWIIPIGLNFKYPIVGTYTLAGTLGYNSRRYLEERVFASVVSYNVGLDLFHMLSSERDMIAGYRYRYSETSRNTTSVDNSLSLGLSGRIIRGVAGSLRVGYQTRLSTDHDRLALGIPGAQSKFDSWTASGSSTYAFNKKLNINGTIAKDFSITATDSSVDTTTLGLDTQYAVNSHLSFMLSGGFGDTRFLGESGRVVLAVAQDPVFASDGTLISPAVPTLLGEQRHDNYITWSGTVSYSLNEHFKAGLTYSWFQNWSSSAIADFVRSSWTFSMSSRW